MTIREIENLMETQVKEMALETMRIKDHNVYLINFDGNFGYSALVYKNGKHIYYANDYELHHRGKTREELRQWYIDTLNNKLFTPEEIVGEIKDYDDFKAKENYLRNYHPMQVDYVSIFGAKKTDINGLHYNPVSFCYMADEEFIKLEIYLMNKLHEQKEKFANNMDYWVNAFKKEMYNHEYAINWQADYDTLSAFGNLTWKGDDARLTEYFDQLGFNNTQKTAYVLARRQYYKENREEW